MITQPASPVDIKPAPAAVLVLVAPAARVGGPLRGGVSVSGACGACWWGRCAAVLVLVASAARVGVSVRSAA
ncbi:MAG: hypothetical protein R6U13_00525 [Desulfatiglandaceae bacterium]